MTPLPSSPPAEQNSNGRPQLVASFDYCDLDGRLLFQVRRFEPGFHGEKKSFAQYTPNGTGGFKKGLNGTQPTIYKLPEVRRASPELPVLVVEGEAKVDTLRALDLVSTCSPMGANKWRDSFSEFLRDRHVFVLPDADEPGRKHASQVKNSLHGIAASCTIVELPGLERKQDIIDWLKIDGNDKEKLLTVCMEAAHAAEQPTGEADTANDHQEEDQAGRSIGFRNFYEFKTKDKEGNEVRKKAGSAAPAIAAELLALTGGWPKRLGGKNPRLFVDDSHRIMFLEKPDALFGYIHRKLGDERTNRLVWEGGAKRVTQAQFFAYLSQTVESFDAVETLPHFPAIPGTYYSHPPLPRPTGKALHALLSRFEPASDVDAALIKSLALTMFWGAAPGQRPAYLIDSLADDPHGGRGVGKTKLGQAVSNLAGGHFDARPGEEIDKLMTRLLSPAAMDRRIAMLDNVRTLRFSWADLEALITTDVISGRVLYVGEGQRPNHLLWIITLNAATLSRDLAQRTVPIQLKRPERNPNWEGETWKLIADQRWEIIADIIDELQRDAPPLSKFSRWAPWEKAVLARVPNPSEAQRVIAERQATIDDDAAEESLVRCAFLDILRERGHEPDEQIVWFSAAQAAEVINKAIGDRMPTNKASKFLGKLSIREVRKSDLGESRGWCWSGKNAPADTHMAKLMEPMPTFG